MICNQPHSFCRTALHFLVLQEGYPAGGSIATFAQEIEILEVICEL